MRKVSTTLIALVVMLVTLGVVILASVSSVRGSSSFNDPQYFLKRQLVWLAVALVASVIASRIDYHYWRKLSPYMLILSVVLLVAVFLPGIGLRVGGSSRWIRLGPLTLQSSEVAKFSVITGLAAWLNRIGRRVDNFTEGLLYPGIGMGIIIGLIMLETDFGTSVLISIVCLAMLFAAGTRLSYLLPASFIAGCCALIYLMQNKLRWSRIMAFMHPDDPEFAGKAYHLIQSRIAFINGGWFGVGLGNSIQKHDYLPEAHTDFIFAIIGEELGFVASISVVLIYAALLVCGLIISIRAADLFGKLTAFGLTVMIVMQAFINIAVVTGSAPTKGIALPFISYGGSSLIVSMAAVGVLLNIAGKCEVETSGRRTRPIKDKLRRF
jgi:cell division protein FtsW